MLSHSCFPMFSSGFLPNYLLPNYDEVVNRPATPPPPYSALHAGPPACSSPLTTDQQEGHCPSRQTTSVPPVSDMLCSRPSLEEIHTSSSYHQKNESKGPLEVERSSYVQNAPSLEQPLNVENEGECGKELLRNAKSGEKERITGRHRRFTGDSGIEVCVCGRGSESCDPKEFVGLLSEGDKEELCEECGHHSYSEEEQGLLSQDNRVEHRASPQPQPYSVCLYLHTINEQEGSHHGSTESQN